MNTARTKLKYNPPTLTARADSFTFKITIAQHEDTPYRRRRRPRWDSRLASRLDLYMYARWRVLRQR